jgi:hypothetical protein
MHRSAGVNASSIAVAILASALVFVSFTFNPVAFMATGEVL